MKKITLLLLSAVVAFSQSLPLPKATEAQARAGTDNNTVMTPLRTKQAIEENGGSGTVTSVNGIEPSAGNVTLTPTDLGAATAPTSTTLSGGGPYALTLGPAPYPRYTVAINAATTFTANALRADGLTAVQGGDGAIIENTVSGAPRVVTYPTAYRNNAAATSTSVSVSSPRSEFFLKYTGSEYRWYDQEYTLDDAASLSYAADAGSTDSYAITLYPTPTAYVTGTQYRFKANTANTGAATLNVNGLGAKTIVKYAGGANTALADNDIRAGQHVLCVYDGTYMQMQSTLGNAASGSSSNVLFVTGSTTEVISNSAAETSIASGTIPANTLGTGTGKIVHVTIVGSLLNNTGATKDYTFAVKYGATTLYSDATGSGTIAASGTPRVIQIDLWLSGDGSTSSQRAWGGITIGNTGAATVGSSDMNTSNLLGRIFMGTSSEDSTASKTLSVDITLSSASSSFTWTTYRAVAYLVQ